MSLAETDKHGAPYVIPRGVLTCALAREIATSKHPARVLAVTSVYRYGRFSLEGDAVTVTMMGNVIARFTDTALYLFTCGYLTASTVEAFNNLVSGGWFYRDQRCLYFERYGARQPPEYKPVREQVSEGQAFAYAQEGSRA